ncbi:aldehyde dehydrogenase (NADP(+)) [Paenarthrobacter sp. NPDC090522]|uniref:aldehyde dehydrogenase (NADP(+)) n=1 Tax=Paenarthrobacter sp. NPDC090522 TaxID=3364383 RepID=UPI0038241490
MQRRCGELVQSIRSFRRKKNCTMTTVNATSEEELESVLAASEKASRALRLMDRQQRAGYLDAVADALDASADALVPVAQAETNLPEIRLRSELKRTTFQLRLFSDVVRTGEYLDVRIDHADPEWPMGAPRPDLRRMLVPVGPVVVFSASNFPFAFSVAGGDTASALAAGCPVVVKAHGGHPLLSAETARVVSDALGAVGAPEGTFGIVYGTDSGRVVVQDRRIKAAGFTGSIPGGRALFDLAAARPDPIPFYGELGSNNPVFVTRAADQTRGEQIAAEFIGSFTMGSGQFCTKPGTLAVPRGSSTLAALQGAQLPDGGALLNDRIRHGYLNSVKELQAAGAKVLNAGAEPFADTPSPVIHLITIDDVLAHPAELLGECFGPSSLVIEYDTEEQLIDLAGVFEGQLTATVQAEDDCNVDELITVLSEKAGRVLWNQWPTGVSVTYAQQHGGPYPASTISSSTSVGTAAIERFLRPVSFQGFPQQALPEVLRDHTSDPLPRLIDGK